MPDAAPHPSRARLALAGGASLLVAVAIGLVVMLGYGGDNAVDRGWAELMVSMRDGVPWFLEVARGLDWFGGGWRAISVVPVVAILALVIARRPWAALWFALSTLVGAALVQLLKHLFARERPQDMLVTSDVGSFPSGHVANACVMALVLALVLAAGRWWGWALAALYAVAMLVSRTYLSVHWLTDTLGGAALAVGVVLLLGAALAGPLARERAAAEARRSGTGVGTAGVGAGVSAA